MSLGVAVGQPGQLAAFRAGRPVLLILGQRRNGFMGVEGVPPEPSVLTQLPKLRAKVGVGDDGAVTLDADDRLRYLHRSVADDRATYRCLSFHPCVVHDLVDAGFMVESLTYEDGTALLRGAVVGYEVLEGVMETAGETVGAELKRVYALRAKEEDPVATQWDLTPAQEETLRTALVMGYFRVPRDVTAADVAAELDISKSAFIERLHRGQHALLSQVFDA
jgi:predicted DNA binding protein